MIGYLRSKRLPSALGLVQVQSMNALRSMAPRICWNIWRLKGRSGEAPRQIAEEIESVGGYLNAATSHQRTGYYARVLKCDIALGVDILADILQNPAFDQDELVKEQEVVVQEIGEAADTPDDVVFEMLQEATWDGHTLARPILGTPSSVRAMTPEGLRAFMSRTYRPEENDYCGRRLR